MTTSHHINGFWFHITWDGDRGIDQHGTKWTNRTDPVCYSLPLIKALTLNTKEIILAMSKN